MAMASTKINARQQFNPSQKGSALISAQLNDDIHIKDVDKAHSGSKKLQATPSGPMLTEQMSQGGLDSLMDIPFEQLCATGAEVTSKTWLSKIW